jgi:hypothetical protein
LSIQAIKQWKLKDQPYSEFSVALQTLIICPFSGLIIKVRLSLYESSVEKLKSILQNNTKAKMTGEQFCLYLVTTICATKGLMK